MHQPLLLVRKILVSVIHFWFKGIKTKSLGAKSGLYTGWAINLIFWLFRKSFFFETMSECSHCHGEELYAFPAFSEFLRRLLANKVVYYSELTVLRCSNATVTTWLVMPKIEATICFAFCWNNFCWILLFLEDSSSVLIKKKLII